MNQPVSPDRERFRARRAHRGLRALYVVLAVLFVIVALVYGRLLFGPISLGFLSERAQTLVASVLDESYEVEWEEFGLSLSGPFSPVFRLGEVNLRERGSTAEITMDALEIGVSPLGALTGQPQARIALVGAHFQTVQDLMGPRLGSFSVSVDEQTGETLVEIQEAASDQPMVRIRREGLSLGGAAEAAGASGLRSDNERLIANVEAMNLALADMRRHGDSGQVSRISVRDASVGVLDPVFGLYKEFDNVDARIRFGSEDGEVSGTFSARIAGRTMEGTFARRLTGDGPQITGSIENLDFATLVPFLDDADGLAALRGAGTMTAEIGFSPEDGSVREGRFQADLTGTRLRMNTDYFPVQTDPFDVVWSPQDARFHFDDVAVIIGKSRGIVTGDVVLGFDRQFGPTLGMSVRARDVYLQPEDMHAPDEPFDLFSFEGWAAPLYGALGVDRLVAAREGVSLVVQGRLDTLRSGVGVDLTLGGRGASADDVKRLWPYIFAPEARDWFVQYVADGKVETADMRFDFPVGTLDMDGEPRPIPDGAMRIDLVGSEVQLQPFEGLPEFAIEGFSRVSLVDNRFTMGFDRAVVAGEAGDIVVTHAAYLNQDTSAPEQVFEISGDISGSVPALMELANSDGLDLLSDVEFGFDFDDLVADVDGDTAVTAIATIATDTTGQVIDADYALNGTVSALRTLRPIDGVSLDDMGLAFTASQEGFRVTGAGEVFDVPLELLAVKSGTGDPEITLGATLEVAQAESFGVDLSEFMTGNVRVAARPMADGTFQISADLTDASLTLRDIGVSKERGAEGLVNAVIAPGEDTIAVTQLDLGFGSVRLQGGLAFGYDGTLELAEFSSFQLAPGDSASVAMRPITGGFALSVTGEQLDIKPVLKRFFNLEGDQSVGASAELEDQVFDISVELDRALGYFGTVALNVDLDLSVRGDELRRVNLAAQMPGGRSISATTNSNPEGQTITYASNDIGGVLRFVGVYPRLVGGDGTLVMRYNARQQRDRGEFVLRNFSIVDEANVAQVVGQHQDSRALISRGSSMSFDYGRAEFTRTADQIEVIEGALHGDAVGGTIRGNIFTQSGQYDLAGTYVPLFGLNNVFQQIPLLGPIFGGRDGEGLLGVTFAVRGPLDNPDLLVNPVSILAPGMFRSLFEYRASRSGDS
ncbi:hypothetical protein [Pelagibacterium montanilacus]|uniref:hypothetical protein n=1 Tax=Pelagibacterium montanilacus TaxID=2185280 RepID=UPI000F8C7100|nr:hypothetical protein [Pelagibacterium montanilacus]